MSKHTLTRFSFTALAASAATVLMLACAAPGAGSEPLSGVAAWQANCSNCHAFRSPEDYSDSQWGVAMMHMRIRANLPADEARAIEEFLKSSN